MPPALPQSRNTVYLIIAIFISGLVWYRIGLFTKCSSSWMTEFSGSANPSFRTPSRLSHMQASKLGNKTESLPYQCGVVLFYHIPSTGGASINRWLLKHDKYLYYTMWGIEVDKSGKFHPNPQQIEKKFVEGMNKHVQNIGPNEWRIAHSHILSTYMNESEKELDQWRADVESQGCHMINTVMLRDPLNHAMSLYKIIGSKNSTRKEWTKYLSSPTARGIWATQLDFLLYNNFARRNPYNVSKEEKVRRGLELLDRHFDIVAIANHDFFVNEVVDMTGWEYIKMPRTNVYSEELSYTKKEVENLQKLLSANGDDDFYNAVKMRYEGALSYL